MRFVRLGDSGDAAQNLRMPAGESIAAGGMEAEERGFLANRSAYGVRKTGVNVDFAREIGVNADFVRKIRIR